VSLAEVPLVLMLLGLSAYTVLGGADFGAGLWFALTRRRDRDLREQTFHAMAPVWEANHVWLVFVVVVCWTAYPVAFASIFSTLGVPLLIAGLGVILRGTAYALRSGRPSRRQDSVIGLIFSLSSVLTPFALGLAVGAIASRRVPVGNAASDPLGSWINPTSILIGVLAVAISAYMAAVFLAADAARQRDPAMTRALRRRALIAGLVTGVLAIGGLVVLHQDAPTLFDALVDGPGLAAIGVSVAGGCGTLVLVGRWRFEPARYTAAVAVAAILAGGALAQSPTFLPGLTVEEAAANDTTIVVLLAGLMLGALVVVPSLAVLFRLVLRGRFDLSAPIATPETGGRIPRRPFHLTGCWPLGTLGAGGVLGLVLGSATWLQMLGAVVLLGAAGGALPALILREGAQ
jgi:cytochrome bd ubiquinol oxidase subunit II